MAEDALIQMRLSQDADFVKRIEYNLVKLSRTIVEQETEPTLRKQYARGVLGSPAQMAASAAVVMVTHISVLGADGANVRVDSAGTVSTVATDADLYAGLDAMFNVLAGA